MSTKKSKTVEHIPAPGKSSGLRGEALCGRWATYRTGDHEQIRRAAKASAVGVCKRCVAKLAH